MFFELVDKFYVCKICVSLLNVFSPRKSGRFFNLGRQQEWRAGERAHVARLLPMILVSSKPFHQTTWFNLLKKIHAAKWCFLTVDSRGGSTMSSIEETEAARWRASKLLKCSIWIFRSTKRLTDCYDYFSSSSLSSTIHRVDVFLSVYAFFRRRLRWR